MSPVALIEAAEAYEHISKGSALLICAYESDEKFHKLRLQGSIPLSEFQSHSATLEKDKELIFY